ncbi:MAG: hypothetical protein HQL74_11925 [Magnetococcales bacterium]|nr:hypothetical protein [Magnetococcales bacterium]
MSKHSESVPKALRPIFDEIVAITDSVCTQHLTKSYATLARYMAAALARKRPSPLSGGRRKTWAAGIVYALGRVNFLFDPASKPYFTTTDLSALFDVSQGAAYGKSKEIWDELGLMQMDSRWTLPEMLERNPMMWMVFLNGLIVDIREYHRETQEVAVDRGLIPFAPSPEGKDDEIARSKGLLPNLAGGSGERVVRLMSFEITYDELNDQFNERLAHVPEDMEELYRRIEQDTHEAIDHMKKLIAQHPDVPTLYNWLCIAYSRVGKHQEAKQVAQTCFQRHPDYLFGRLNFAEILLQEGKLLEAFNILGRTFVLTELEHSRKKFHFSEVLSFYGAVARYLLRLGKLKSAMSFLDILRKVEPDHHITKWLDELIGQHTPRTIPADARRFLNMR